MSVTAALNHTAETQYENMQTDFRNIVSGYDATPLKACTESKLENIHMQEKWAGGNGDHAGDQKKHHEIAHVRKEEAIEMDLGTSSLLSQGLEVLISTLEVENAQKISDAGGITAWHQLSAPQQVEQDITMMKRLTVRLGKEALAVMPEHDRRKLMLFIWAGCSMHKELNSVKCANKMMMAWWKEKNIPGPILLANRDNAVTLWDLAEEPSDNAHIDANADIGDAMGITDSMPPTKVQQWAWDITTTGGIKAASIAGAIFNHNNDKKGQQDSYQNHFQSILGWLCNFPDTSSICYHLFCAAAAEFIAYTPEYIKFIDVIKMLKGKPSFNHMEANLWNALHDANTKSELAVLAV